MPIPVPEHKSVPLGDMLFGGLCEAYPDTDDGYADPFAEGAEPFSQPTAMPHFYRRDTLLVSEVDALTGYDSAGLFAAYQNAIQDRHAAKKRISACRAAVATLAARFDSKGMQVPQAEHERSQLLAELQDDIRTEYYRSPEKETVPAKRANEEPTVKIVHLTVGEVESRAKAHPRYVRLLNQQGQDRASYQQKLAELDGAWAEYELADGISTYLGLQLEDRKSLIYYAGKEWRHSKENQP